MGLKEAGVAAGRTEVDVPRHNINDLKKRAANGDRLTREELQAVVESERPRKTQVRPTGRVTRTGTEVKPESSRRMHAGKWAARNSG